MKNRKSSFGVFGISAVVLAVVGIILVGGGTAAGIIISNKKADNASTSVVIGCADSSASNFNPLATQDDGQCTYPPIEGCKEPLADNFNPLAEIPTVDCTFSVQGCMSEDANNFNPLATREDGSCHFGDIVPVEDDSGEPEETKAQEAEFIPPEPEQPPTATVPEPYMQLEPGVSNPEWKANTPGYLPKAIYTNSFLLGTADTEPDALGYTVPTWGSSDLQPVAPHAKIPMRLFVQRRQGVPITANAGPEMQAGGDNWGGCAGGNAFGSPTWGTGGVGSDSVSEAGGAYHGCRALFDSTYEGQQTPLRYAIPTASQGVADPAQWCANKCQQGSVTPTGSCNAFAINLNEVHCNWDLRRPGGHDQPVCPAQQGVCDLLHCGDRGSGKASEWYSGRWSNDENNPDNAQGNWVLTTPSGTTVEDWGKNEEAIQPGAANGYYHNGIGENWETSGVAQFGPHSNKMRITDGEQHGGVDEEGKGECARCTGDCGKAGAVGNNCTDLQGRPYRRQLKNETYWGENNSRGNCGGTLNGDDGGWVGYYAIQTNGEFDTLSQIRGATRDQTGPKRGFLKPGGDVTGINPGDLWGLQEKGYNYWATLPGSTCYLNGPNSGPNAPCPDPRYGDGGSHHNSPRLTAAWNAGVQYYQQGTPGANDGTFPLSAAGNLPSVFNPVYQYPIPPDNFKLVEPDLGPGGAPRTLRSDYMNVEGQARTFTPNDAWLPYSQGWWPNAVVGEAVGSNCGGKGESGFFPLGEGGAQNDCGRDWIDSQLPPTATSTDDLKSTRHTPIGIEQNNIYVSAGQLLNPGNQPRWVDRSGFGGYDDGGIPLQGSNTLEGGDINVPARVFKKYNKNVGNGPYGSPNQGGCVPGGASGLPQVSGSASEAACPFLSQTLLTPVCEKIGTHIPGGGDGSNICSVYGIENCPQKSADWLNIGLGQGEDNAGGGFGNKVTPKICANLCNIFASDPGYGSCNAFDFDPAGNAGNGECNLYHCGGYGGAGANVIPGNDDTTHTTIGGKPGSYVTTHGKAAGKVCSGGVHCNAYWVNDDASLKSNKFALTTPTGTAPCDGIGNDNARATMGLQGSICANCVEPNYSAGQAGFGSQVANLTDWSTCGGSIDGNVPNEGKVGYFAVETGTVTGDDATKWPEQVSYEWGTSILDPDSPVPAGTPRS